MKLLLSISLVFSFSAFSYNSSTLKVVDFKTEKINVYGKSYRYTNRVFYKEKMAAVRKCGERFKQLDAEIGNASSLKTELENISVNVGLGRRATVQFQCNVTLDSFNEIKIEEFGSELVNENDCLQAEVELKNELESELVFSSFYKDKCLIQVVTL